MLNVMAVACLRGSVQFCPCSSFRIKVLHVLDIHRDVYRYYVQTRLFKRSLRANSTELLIMWTTGGFVDPSLNRLLWLFSRTSSTLVLIFVILSLLFVVMAVNPEVMPDSCLK